MLTILPDRYAVCRLPAGRALDAPADGAFWALVHAPGETTLVCPMDRAPSGAETDVDWRCLVIGETFAFSTPGILVSVLQPLAAAGIGIFATSTFSTDVVLVKAADLEGAVAALERGGHRVSSATVG
jgi:hypothetical protein